MKSTFETLGSGFRPIWMAPEKIDGVADGRIKFHFASICTDRVKQVQLVKCSAFVRQVRGKETVKTWSRMPNYVKKYDEKRKGRFLASGDRVFKTYEWGILIAGEPFRFQMGLEEARMVQNAGKKVFDTGCEFWEAFYELYIDEFEDGRVALAIKVLGHKNQPEGPSPVECAAGARIYDEIILEYTFPEPPDEPMEPSDVIALNSNDDGKPISDDIPF